MEVTSSARWLNGSLVELLDSTSRYHVPFLFVLCCFDLLHILQTQRFNGLLAQHELLHLPTGR